MTAIHALKKGRLPTNDQMIRILDHFQNSIGGRGLSDEGRTVCHCINAFFESFQRALLEKNEGEHIQQFIFHSELAADAAKSKPF